MRRVRLAGVPSGLLQTFRLHHALADAGIPIAVHPGEADRYRWLERYFDNLDWKVTRTGRALRDVEVDHQVPKTRVGGIERPLLFAEAVAERCRSKWIPYRTDRMTFIGLMTEDRRRTLSRLTDAFGAQFRVVATTGGRTWPSKAWDEEYFSALGRSQLTACPNGDFVWTYRFFEAAFCGSIPVVEDDCDHYEGFHYYHMADPPAEMSWRADWAKENFTTAKERLTVPSTLLREEVAHLARLLRRAR